MQSRYQELDKLQKRLDKVGNPAGIALGILIFVAVVAGFIMLASPLIGWIILGSWLVIVTPTIITAIIRYRQIHPALTRTKATIESFILQNIRVLDEVKPESSRDEVSLPHLQASKPTLSNDNGPISLDVSTLPTHVCPQCHIAHPSFAEYCMKCGKRLPPRNEPAKDG